MGFSFKMGSGDKTEYILGGVLATVILLAIGLTVHHFMTGGRAPRPTEYRLKCINPRCTVSGGYEITYKVKDLPAELGEQLFGTTTGRAQCPECKAQTMVMEDKCPKCGTYYVSKYKYYDPFNYPELEQQGKLKDICPNCKLDISEYHKAHPEN